MYSCDSQFVSVRFWVFQCYYDAYDTNVNSKIHAPILLQMIIHIGKCQAELLCSVSRVVISKSFRTNGTSALGTLELTLVSFFR